jgi:restriction endonuclease Mrr
MARTKARHRVSVLDLINAGMLASGDVVTFEPRMGEVYRGEIGDTGELIFDGIQFPTPSSAATKLARASGLHPKDSRNGWEEIEVRGRPLSEYRERLEGSKPRAVQAPPPYAQPSRSQPPAEPPASVAETSIQAAIVAKLSCMTDRQFEQFVGHLLQELGYADVDVVGRAGDGGVDVRCVLKAPLVVPPLSVVCQVKRHSTNVGPSAVGDLRGRWAHRVDRLILINTAGFTQGAREAAREPGAKEIKLVTGEDLADLMIQKAVGVSKEPVVVEKLDEAFFSRFSS